MEQQLGDLESVNIGKMLKGLSILAQEQQKARNQTYQEVQLQTINNMKKNFLNSLHKFYERGIKSKILNNIIKNHNKYFTCLLGFCDQIKEVINESEIFTFSHKNFTSQSALLALYLSKQLKNPIQLIVTEQSLSQMGHILAGEAEDDKITFTKSQLQKQGIKLHNLKNWDRQSLNIDNNSVVVIDLFNISPLYYSPFLLRNYSTLIKSKKTFIYHSHLQDEEVEQWLNKLKCEAFSLQLWSNHPTQIITQRQESKLFDQLVQFLREDQKHPQKQDVVIFYPVNQQLRRYCAKLKQHFFNAGFKDSILIITKPHQRQFTSKNQIFIVSGIDQLLQWNYNYSGVLYVIDYGKQNKLTFNYYLCAYVEENCTVTTTEKAKRCSLIGNNQFGIYSSFLDSQLRKQSYINEAAEISSYILQYIDYDIQQFLDLKDCRVSQAISLLQRLQIIKKEDKIFKIIDEKSLEYAKQGISPLQYKFISNIISKNQANKDKYANLAIYMVVFLHSRQKIKKQNQQSIAFTRAKPTQMWRKSGFLESCIAITAKCETTEVIISQIGQGNSFRRNSSKIEDSQAFPFASMYQLIQNPQGQQESEKLTVPSFLHQNAVDEQAFYYIREEIDNYRQILNIPKVAIIFEEEDFPILIKQYSSMFKECLLYYTGYLRKGYRSESIQFKQSQIQISAQSLKKSFYLKPLFIAAFRYKMKNDNLEIQIWNTYNQSMYLQTIGSLPIIQKMSQGQIQIEYHGISSLMFEKLWRNNAFQIIRFEEENNCFIEPNHEIAVITIHCQKQKSLKIKENFDNILSKLKESISASNRLIHYLGNTKFYFGAGGLVKEIVIGEYVNKGLIENLHLDVTKQDLYQLIEEFLVVRDINIRLPEAQQLTKSAIVFFNSQTDYYTFYQYFNDCQYFGLKLKITPVRKGKLDFAWEKQYIQFKWFVWQTHNKAMIRFANEEGAVTTFENFEKNCQFDGVKVQIKKQGNNIIMDGLNNITDQIFIEQALSVFGDIEDVQILKTPLRQGPTEILDLEKLIQGEIQNKNYKLQSIQRSKNGLRKCIANFDSADDLMKIVTKYNKSVCQLGVSRFYTVSHFQRSIQIPDTLRNVALPIIQQIFDDFANQNILNRKIISYSVVGEQVIFHSFSKTMLDNTYNKVSTNLKGFNVKLNKAQKNMIFNEIGFSNLLDLQEKHNCKLIINIASQTLTAICRKKIFEILSKEITNCVSNKFSYKIYLTSKSYKYFRNNAEKLNEIKAKYHLNIVQLELDQHSIIIQGSIINVQTAHIYFMYFIETLNKSEDERIHSDVCGICCQEPKQSIRLQACFHRFCFLCMQQYIKSILGDRSLFPIKCPHCSQLVIVEDLNIILDKSNWQKIETMAINKFIADNGQKMAFCYTIGCKEINIINGPVWQCKVCNFTYCNRCREIIHPGFSCDQAINIRQTDDYFVKYMYENGIRKCPNLTCRMPVLKIDGCNKVLCTRCGKSMCFKCKPEQMIPYDTPQLAYDHLNSVHGGYW